MSKSIKIISLNTEEGKHSDSQISFFTNELPDIVCLQEVLESDLHKYKEGLNMDGKFTPTWVRRSSDVEGESNPVTTGIAILSKLPIETCTIISFDDDESNNNQEKTFRSLMVVKFKLDTMSLVVGNVHFTWSPDGIATDKQRRHLNNLLEGLKQIPQIVLCGDFNAPRGGEIFDILSKTYQDNIPIHYKSSIDPVLHKAGKLQLMVDGIFSTSNYKVTNVQLVSGVSDHCAIIAHIS